MENSEKKMVLFLTSCSPYTAGEKASFGPREAHKLVSQNIASYINEDGSKKETKANVNDEPDDEDESPAEGSAGSSGKKGKGGSAKKGSTKRRKRVKVEE